MAQAGEKEDRDAKIRALYREHRQSVGRQLAVLTRDPASVDDLVNETFIRAFQSFDRFRGDASVRTWLHGIALNVGRNHLAKRRRRDAVELPPLTGPCATPEDTLREQRAMQRFHQALDALPEPMREAFVLRYVQQLPLKDVARLLGVPTSTAHARASRAEQHLRTSVEGDGEHV